MVIGNNIFACWGMEHGVFPSVKSVGPPSNFRAENISEISMKKLSLQIRQDTSRETRETYLELPGYYL